MTKGQELSVQIIASATADSITLRFAAPGSYRIWRKRPKDQSWGAPIWERPLGMEIVDQNVAPGEAWEYKVVEFNTGACGYVSAGFQVPLVTNRGKLVLVVERTHASALAVELERFEADLARDGYMVVRRECSSTDLPESVKATLKAAYLLDPDHTNTAILFGAVPVKLSGPINYDGHGDVLVAADGFYADMSGDWSGSPGIFPAPLRLMLGRIDFSTMTCFSNKPVNPRSERDLLRQYLNRNHAWKTGQWSVARRGAVRDGFPDRDFSRNAWDNMPNLCRDGIDEIPDGQFFTALSEVPLVDTSHLIAFACGGGQITSMAGTGGSDDFALNNIQVPFLMLLGSAMLGRWDRESSFPRAALASGDDEKGCLCAFGAGAPHVFIHRLALGGTIGESFLLAQNNFTVYQPNGFAEDGLYSPSASTEIPNCRGLVHQSLMGDPTLTLFPQRKSGIFVLDVMCSTDRGTTWRVVQTTEIDTTGTQNAMFKLGVR